MANAVHDYQYSVEVKSRFDLLMNDDLNDEDPDKLLDKLRSQRKKHDQKAAASKASTKDVKSEPVVKVLQQPEAVVQSLPPAPHPEVYDLPIDRAPARGARGGGRPRGQSRGFVRGGRGGFGPRGGYGGQMRDGDGMLDGQPREPGSDIRGRGGFTRSRPPRYDHHDFDRRSGSDMTRIRAVPKKDGYGSGNWGTIEDEMEATMGPSPVEEEAAVQAKSEQEEAAPVEEVSEVKEPEDEEPPQLTLEEYKARQKGAKITIQLTTKGNRAANDGKDVFKNMVVHKKVRPVTQQSDTASDEEEEDIHEEAPKIAFQFTDRLGGGQMRGRGRGRVGFERRGGRGGPRGMRGGRGTPRGFGDQESGPRITTGPPPPSMNSDLDFPSLQ